MGSGVSVASKTTCEFCSEQLLTIFSRKKCATCPKIVCSKCLRSSDATSSIAKQKLCPKCFLLATGNFSRKDLDPYTVKELRNFLVQKDISTEGCKEKYDLVELVLQMSRCENPLNQNDSEHSRHVELLRRRFRNADLPEINELSSVSDQHSSSPHSTSEQSESVRPSASSASLQQREGTSPGVASPDRDQEYLSEMEMEEYELWMEEDVQDSRNHVPQDLQTASRTGMTLDDIKDESELIMLTVRQLKEVLGMNFVDYKGCCEKPELLDRVTRLWRQHINKPEGTNIDQIPTEELCKICMDDVIDCILLECGHMVTCTKCGKRLPECPVCRCYVSRVVHIFRT